MATVLVATRDGLVVVPDSGEQSSHFDGRSVVHVSGAPNRWVALVDSSVWTCEDGDTWTQLGDVEGEATCVLDAGADVWVGAEDARLQRVGSGDVESFGAVPGRDGWYTPWGGPPAVRSMDRSAEALYVNVHVGGIPRSLDDGETWSPTIDIDTDVHEVRCIDGVVYAATAVGLATSDDGGDTWTFTSDGLRHDYCRAVAVPPDAVLLSASSGPGGADSSLYRKPLDADTFEPCGGGFPGRVDGNIDTHWLSASGSTIACGLPDGRVLLSGDEGATWMELAGGLPAINAVLCVP